MPMNEDFHNRKCCTWENHNYSFSVGYKRSLNNTWVLEQLMNYIENEIDKAKLDPQYEK